MNLSTVAIALLAWQMLSNTQNTKKSGAPDLFDFLSDDTKTMLNCVEKLSSNRSSNDDKIGAILQMMSNPVIMEFVQNTFGKKAEGEAPKEEQKEERFENKEERFENQEGYKFETPSADCKEFFRPIENIADNEVKNKLYWFYENWYIT